MHKDLLKVLLAKHSEIWQNWLNFLKEKDFHMLYFQPEEYAYDLKGPTKVLDLHCSVLWPSRTASE